jgi:pyruvate kinase
MGRHIHRGDRVRMDDGKTGVVISATEDGSVQIKTETGIVISSPLDEAELGPCDNGDGART